MFWIKKHKERAKASYLVLSFLFGSLMWVALNEFITYGLIISFYKQSKGFVCACGILQCLKKYNFQRTQMYAFTCTIQRWWNELDSNFDSFFKWDSFSQTVMYIKKQIQLKATILIRSHVDLREERVSIKTLDFKGRCRNFFLVNPF